MLEDFRIQNHTATCLRAAVAWVTKDSKSILCKSIIEKCSVLLKSIAESLNVKIEIGYFGKYYVYMIISYPPNLSISEIVQKLKGYSSKALQMEFLELKKYYLKDHLWASGYICFSDNLGNLKNGPDNEKIMYYINNYSKLGFNQKKIKSNSIKKFYCT
jgi:putative transposase